MQFSPQILRERKKAILVSALLVATVLTNLIFGQFNEKLYSTPFILFNLLMLALSAFIPLLLDWLDGTILLLTSRNVFTTYYSIIFLASGIYLTLNDGPVLSGSLNYVDDAYYYVFSSFLATIGIQIFQIVYTMRNHAMKPAIDLDKRIWSLKSGIIFFIFWLFIAYSCTWLLLASNGGLQLFLVNREQWRVEGVIGSGIYTFPASGGLVFASLGLLIPYLRSQGANSSKTLFISICLVSLLPAYLFGFRIVLIPPIICYLILWDRMVKSIKVPQLFVIVGVLMVFMVWYGVTRNKADESKISEKSWLQLSGYFVLRAPGTELVATILKKLDTGVPLDYGVSTIEEVATIIIPKVVFPEKPVPSSLKISETFFSSLFVSRGGGYSVMSGISPTVIGSLLYDFGILGVAIGMGVFGYICSVADALLLGYMSFRGFLKTYMFINFFSMLAEGAQGAYNTTFMLFIFYLFLVFSLKSISAYTRTPSLN